MINPEKFFLAVVFTGFVTAHTGFWGEINTSALAAGYNSATNSSVMISSDLSSDSSGNSALIKNKQNEASSLSPRIVTAIQNDLRQRTGLEPSNYTITRVTSRTWPDGCLGLGGPAESCLFAMTPGWRVVVTSNNRRSTWVYRTNQSGSNVRLASPR